MTNTAKEQAFKMIEGRIESIQTLSIECIDYIYLAAHNEAIEMVAQHFEKERWHPDHIHKIRNLKVESTEQIGLKK